MSNTRHNELLFEAARKENNAVIAAFLDKHGFSVDEKDGSDTSLLMWAALYGSRSTVEMLLERGAVFNGQNIHGQTVLSLAAQNGHTGIVRLLLEKGASIIDRDEHGHTAQQTAAMRGHAGTAALLKDWPEILKAEKHAQWLEDTDFSKGLKSAIPAPRPFKGMKP